MKGVKHTLLGLQYRIVTLDICGPITLYFLNLDRQARVLCPEVW